MEDRLQLSRLELKYTIREEVALQVREFVRSYLEIDEYGATRPNLSYPVHSLYLDSDDLVLYWNTINGNKNRYKLRLRFYESRSSAPVYFEIKRRMNNAILKQRGGVRREAVDWILGGHLPEPTHLLSNDPKQLAALQRFSQLLNQHHCKPKAHIVYQREAWISPHNNSVRLTMDRDVMCDPDPTTRLATSLLNPVCVFGKSVILELKFTGRFPDWFGELVRIFNLVQGPAAKYADGVALCGENKFSPAWQHLPDREAIEQARLRKEMLQKRCAGVLIPNSR
ncbi:MAG: polyphosphate polymerase domain-containing protein [Verrucomicrobiota bacterium]